MSSSTTAAIGDNNVPPPADGAAGDGQHPNPPPDWQRCRAFMPSKGRFCRASKNCLVPPPPNSSHEAGDEAIYCGNHAHLYDSGAATNGNVGVDGSGNQPRKKGKRIPCPIDPSHEVYESRLEKHLKVCPAATRRQDDVALPYYREKINCGGCGNLSLDGNGNDGVNGAGRPTKRNRSNDTNDASCSAETATTCRNRKDQAAWAKEMALKVLNAYDTLFLGGKLPTTNGLAKLTPERIQHLSALTFDDLISGIPTEDLSEAELNSGLQSTVSVQKIRAGGPKHLRQIGSLIGHLRQLQLLPGPTLSGDIGEERKEEIDTVLEMGAGRGMTGLVAAGVLSASKHEAKLIMVERSGTRGKADTSIRRAIEAKKQRDSSNGGDGHSPADNKYLDLTSVEMTRIKCDLAHVHLPTALEAFNESQSSQQNIIVVAKHLCGAGTDLALKSLQSISDRIAGCVFATCCHGVCNWTDYVGRDYLLDIFASSDDQTFGEQEFDLMKKWGAGSAVESTSSSETSGATGVADDKEDEDEKHNTYDAEQDTIEYPEKLPSVVTDLSLACGTKGLGRACQRLIDYGRVEFMKHVLFKDRSGSCGERATNMKHYVDPDVTPQNALLCSTCRL